MQVLCDYSFKSYMLSVLDWHKNYLPLGEKALTHKNMQKTVLNIIYSTLKKENGYQSLLDMAGEYPQLLKNDFNENDFYFKELDDYTGTIRLLATAFSHEIERVLTASFSLPTAPTSNVYSLKHYKSRFKN